MSPARTMSSGHSVIILSNTFSGPTGLVSTIPTFTDVASLTVRSISSRPASSRVIYPTSDEDATAILPVPTWAPSTITTSFQAIVVEPGATFTTETWSVTTSTPRATIVEPITSSTSTSSNSVSQSSSALNTLSPVTAGSDTNKPGLSSDTRIGIGIGIPLGLAILSALIYLLWRLRRNKLRKVAQGGAGKSTEFHAMFQKPEMDGTGKIISQLNNPRLHELEAPTKLQISELEAVHGSSEVL